MRGYLKNFLRDKSEQDIEHEIQNDTNLGYLASDLIDRDIRLEKKRVYISGPIRGRRNYEERFYKRASKLEKLNYDPVIPFVESRKIGIEADNILALMQFDIKLLANCDLVCMIQGWETSKGAIAEKAFAEAVGIKVMHEDEFGDS